MTKTIPSTMTDSLPSGMWQRGGVYYARFRHNGAVIRKRLSRDYEAACLLLGRMKRNCELTDLGLKALPVADEWNPPDEIRVYILFSREGRGRRAGWSLYHVSPPTFVQCWIHTGLLERANAERCASVWQFDLRTDSAPRVFNLIRDLRRQEAVKRRRALQARRSLTANVIKFY